MTKRLLVSVLSVFMMMSVLFAAPVSAEVTLPDNIATDYVPGEVTGNMVAAGTNGVTGYVWGGNYTYGARTNTLMAGVQSGKYYYFKTTADVTDPTTNQYDEPVIGFVINTVPTANATGKVVYSVTMKDGNGAKIKIGRKNTTYTSTQNPLRVEYPENYEDGFPLTAGYVAYTGTFADTEATSDKYIYSIGFVEANAQSTFRMDTTATYIGYEYARDMVVTADGTDIAPGGAVTFNAQIVNQVGAKSDLNQDITWYALNQDRTAVVPGINIQDNGDGSVTVSSANNVETGTYCIVAVSDEYPDFVKGTEITIENIDYSDYIPGEITGNWFGESLSLSFNYHHRTKLEGEASQVDDVSLSSAAEHWSIRALRNLDAPETQYSDPDGNGAYSWDGTSYYYHHPFSGGAAATATPPDNSTANVVYSLKVKNGNSSYTPVVGIGRRNPAIQSTKNPKRVEYPIEYDGSDKGLTVTDTEWQDFKGTFVVGEGFELSGYDGYTIGLAAGNVKGAEVHISKSDAYLGIEYIYDLTLTADGTELAAADDVINLDYAVVNQIGTKGAIPQDVEFLVMSPDRQTIIEDSGITVTDNYDGTASVSVDPFTAIAGDYDIVAYNDENRMAKGVRVTVKESDLISTLQLSDFSGNAVTATAKILNKTNTPINAVLVVIMTDDDNELQDVKMQKIAGLTSADGVNTYTETLTATDITKVTKAKAFLLDCGSSSEFEIYDTTLVELALSLTSEKE